MEDEEIQDLLVIQKTQELQRNEKEYKGKTRILWLVYIVFAVTEGYIIKLLLSADMTVGSMIGLQAVHVIVIFLLFKVLNTYRKLLYNYTTLLNKKEIEMIKGGNE